MVNIAQRVEESCLWSLVDPVYQALREWPVDQEVDVGVLARRMGVPEKRVLLGVRLLVDLRLWVPASTVAGSVARAMPVAAKPGQSREDPLACRRWVEYYLARAHHWVYQHNGSREGPERLARKMARELGVSRSLSQLLLEDVIVLTGRQREASA